MLFTSNGLPDKQVDLCSNGSQAHVVKDGHGEEGNEHEGAVLQSTFQPSPMIMSFA